MKEIPVNASIRYCVSIENGLLQKVGQQLLRYLKPCTVCIISDSHVWPLYGEIVRNSLMDAGFQAVYFQFPASEESKNASTYLEILHFLAENQITRSDCILALGGGVTGDLAGFAAATYLRGIPYVQVPTSLLAMVDSAIGGKTGIDLPAGKNLCGAFYHPLAVFCDPQVLDTLPEAQFSDSCAEIIKYAILEDSGLFAHLEETGRSFDRAAVIARCVEQKAALIAQDEFDRGSRMLLNLGHTIGHAIESASEYTVSHGQAVAMGIAAVCQAGHCPDSRRILALLQHFELPTESPYPSDKLMQYILSDKKRSAGAIQWIIPKIIGHCQIVAMPIGQVLPFLEEGL